MKSPEELLLIAPNYLKICNLDYLHELGDGDAEFILDMVNTFLQEVVVAIDALHVAVENYNLTEVKFLAHKLKPMCLYVGLQEEHELCKSLELLSVDNDIDDRIKDVFKNLESHIHKAYSELNAWLSV